MKLKKEKGITLIALVITIIVLIILAGVSINLLLGQYGVITRVKDAAEATEVARVKEEIQIDIIGKQAENNGNISESSLETILAKYVANPETDIIKNEDGTVKEIITKKGNYTIAMVDIWNGTTANPNTNTGVDVGDLFDETGTEEGKLHIGDFINYLAGTWTDTDMTVCDLVKISV